MNKIDEFPFAHSKQLGVSRISVYAVSKSETLAREKSLPKRSKLNRRS
uniref:Uncharacterized protein n=1 Tax=Lepeophtheirus salmonis TaxID=72036 RepID=A0A0K2U9Y6_LEPSM